MTEPVIGLGRGVIDDTTRGGQWIHSKFDWAWRIDGTTAVRYVKNRVDGQTYGTDYTW